MMPDDVPRFDDWVKTQDPNRIALANPRVRDFLDRIGQSEGADYNTLVGGARVNDLSRHPNRVGLVTSAGPSTAFGKYQIVGSTERSKLRRYSDLDYSPENQDVRAVELLRQTGALEALERGDTQTAIQRASREWASLPGSPLPGRKNARAFQDTQPAPQIPKFDDWVKSQPSEQVSPPIVSADQVTPTSATPAPRISRRRPRSSQIESIADLRRLDDTAPISWIDLKQAEDRAFSEAARPIWGLIPKDVDPRVLKGEQPADRLAAMRRSDVQTRLEPRRTEVIADRPTAIQGRRLGLLERAGEVVSDYAPGIASLDTPAGPKTDIVRGAISAATLGALDLHRPVTREEELLHPQARTEQAVAEQIGSTAGFLVPLTGTARLVNRIAALQVPTRAAAAARVGLTFGGVEAARQAIQAGKTGEFHPDEILVSTAIGAAMGAIPAARNPTIKQRLVAAILPQALADYQRGTPLEQAVLNAGLNLGFEATGIARDIDTRREGRGLQSEIQPSVEAQRAEVKPAILVNTGTTPEGLRPRPVPGGTQAELRLPEQPAAVESRTTDADIRIPRSRIEMAIETTAAQRDRLTRLESELNQWQRAGGQTRRGRARIQALQQEITGLRGEIEQSNQRAQQQVAQETAVRVESTRYSPTPRFDEWVENETGQRMAQVPETELGALRERYRQEFANAPAPPALREMPPLNASHYSNRQPRRVRGEGKGQFKRGKPVSVEESIPVESNVPAEQPAPPTAEPAIEVVPPASETASPPAGSVTTPVAEVSRPAMETTRPRPTAPKDAAMQTDHAELGLPELEQLPRVSAQQVLTEARRRNQTSPRATDTLVDQSLKGGKNFTNVETMQLNLRAQEVKNHLNEINTEAYKETDPSRLADLRAESDTLLAEFDRISTAQDKAGAEWSRAGTARQRAIAADYSLVGLVARAKKAKGRDLTTEERTRYEQQSGRITELESQLDLARSRADDKRFQREIDKLARSRRRGDTRQSLDTEYAQLLTDFRQARAEVPRVQASGLAGLDPEGKLTRIVLRMARNRVLAGVNSASQLVDDIYADVRELLPGATQRDIRDAISGYSLIPKTQRTDLQKRLDSLRSELQSLSKEEDVAAGVRSPRREGPTRGEARRLPMEGPRLSDVRKLPAEGPKLSEAPRQGPREREGWKRVEGPRLTDVQGRKEGPRLSEGPKQGPRLREGWRQIEGPRLSEGQGRVEGPKQSEIRRVRPGEGPDMVAHGPSKRFVTRNEQRAKQMTEQIVDLQRRIDEQDFTPRAKQQRLPYTKEVQRLEEQLQHQKNRFELEMERASPGHWLRQLSGIRKSWMLSGLSTQAKNIGGTGAYQVFDEIARLPAVIADAAIAPLTNRRTITANPVAMLDSVIHTATVGRREAGQILRQGATAEQLERHQFSEIDTGVKVIDFTSNLVFRVMSASDRIFYNYAYARNLHDRARAQAINEGASSKRARTKELVESPPEELKAAAKHDALVSTFNNNNQLSNAIKRARAQMGPTANFAIDMVMPFDRTPTNVIARIIEASPVGGTVAATRLAKGLINKSLTAEQQRQFSQTLGRATVGTALMALGWTLADKDVLDVEKYQVFINIGNQRYDLASISPVGNILALGARLRKDYDKGSATGAVKTVAGVPLQQPLLKSTTEVVESFSDPERSLTRTGARLVSSFIPMGGLVRDVGKLIDPEERRAVTFKEQVQQNIPVARQRLPVRPRRPKRLQISTGRPRVGARP